MILSFFCPFGCGSAVLRSSRLCGFIVSGEQATGGSTPGPVPSFEGAANVFGNPQGHEVIVFSTTAALFQLPNDASCLLFGFLGTAAIEGPAFTAKGEVLRTLLGM